MDFTSMLAKDLPTPEEQNAMEMKVTDLMNRISDQVPASTLDVERFETVIEQTIVSYRLDVTVYEQPLGMLELLRKENSLSVELISNFLQNDLIVHVIQKANGGNAMARIHAMMLLADAITKHLTPGEALPAVH